MNYIYDKLLIINGIKSVERTNSTLKLLISGDYTDYYRQIFQDYIVIKYLYLDYEPIIPLIFCNCFMNMLSVKKIENKYGISVTITFKQTTPERSLKLKRIMKKINGKERL